jgi:uncharacterized protein (UPF0335 family)
MMDQKRYERLMRKIEKLQAEVGRLSNQVDDCYSVANAIGFAYFELDNAKHNLTLQKQQDDRLAEFDARCEDQWFEQRNIAQP